MIKKFTLSMIILMASPAFFSCGRTVPIASDTSSGEMSVHSVRIPVETTSGISEITEPTTAEQTTEPPVPTAPEQINIDVSTPADYAPLAACVIEGFETVMQMPELPTGCEVTALAQTINFYGFGIDKVDLCDTFMPIDSEAYWSMDEAYLGDPKSYNGFGCNAAAIARTADSYFDCIGSDWYAVNLTGISLQEVFYQIEEGRPVIVWSTIDQRQTYAEYQFRHGCGKEFYFNPFQHCLTIYGFDYDTGTVAIADPLVGNVNYDMARFESIYNEMGKQAVILLGNAESAGVEYNDIETQEKWIEVNQPREITEVYSGTEVVYGNNYGRF